jgi:hypothetical protein
LFGLHAVVLSLPREYEELIGMAEVVMAQDPFRKVNYGASWIEESLRPDSDQAEWEESNQGKHSNTRMVFLSPLQYANLEVRVAKKEGDLVLEFLQGDVVIGETRINAEQFAEFTRQGKPGYQRIQDELKQNATAFHGFVGRRLNLLSPAMLVSLLGLDFLALRKLSKKYALDQQDNDLP